MNIKTDIRVVKGEHNNVPFEFKGGVLEIGGRCYAKADIKALVEIANLLEIEGFKIIDHLQPVKRQGYRHFLQGLYPIDPGYYGDDSEEGQ